MDLGEYDLEAMNKCGSENEIRDLNVEPEPETSIINKFITKCKTLTSSLSGSISRSGKSKQENDFEANDNNNNDDAPQNGREDDTCHTIINDNYFNQLNLQIDIEKPLDIVKRQYPACYYHPDFIYDDEADSKEIKKQKKRPVVTNVRKRLKAQERQLNQNARSDTAHRGEVNDKGQHLPKSLHQYGEADNDQSLLDRRELVQLDNSRYPIVSPYRINPSLLDVAHKYIGTTPTLDTQRLNYGIREPRTGEQVAQSNGNQRRQIKHTCEKTRILQRALACLPKHTRFGRRRFVPTIEDFQRDEHGHINDATYNYYDMEDDIMEVLYTSKTEEDALNVLAQMWRESRFCDLMFIVQDAEYLAHRVVIAYHSLKYRSYFKRHRYDFVSRIHLRSSSHRALQIVLRYLYTNELLLNLQFIEEVVICAKELDVKYLVAACEEYLANFERRNVFKVLEVSRKQDLKAAYYEAYWFLLSNFDECITSENFLEAPYWLVKEIIADPHLHLRKEELLWACLMDWLNANRPVSPTVAFDIIRHVRFSQLKHSDLRYSINKVPHIFDDIQIKNFIRNLTNKHVVIADDHSAGRSKSSHPNLINFKKSLLDPDMLGRRGYDLLAKNIELGHDAPNYNQSNHPNAFSLCHRTNFSKSGIRTISMKNHRMASDYSQHTLLSSAFSNGLMKIMRKSGGVGQKSSKYSLVSNYSIFRQSSSTGNQTLYVGGGFTFDRNVVPRTDMGIYEYDADERQWHFLATIPERRHHHKLIGNGEKIFVVGGSFSHPLEGEVIAKQNWSLNIVTKEWTAVPPMNDPRVYFDVAMINDRIVVVGGMGANGQLLGSIEAYRPYSAQWKMLKRLKVPRLGVAVASLNDRLYMVGGYAEGKREPVLCNVTCYDPMTNTWFKRRPLTIARCHASLVACNEYLYLLGGSAAMHGRGLTSTPYIERYNETTDQWTSIVQMPQPRHDVTCVVNKNKIYVIGGFYSKRNTLMKNIDVFDTEISEWSSDVHSLYCHLVGVSACTASAIRSHGRHHSKTAGKGAASSNNFDNDER
ncbi:hypothetical protein SNEBB_006263 [Seison nebaliae]|nr:hypothetical protein SNEBB_006263 [Seison nebaliae]